MQQKLRWHTVGSVANTHCNTVDKFGNRAYTNTQHNNKEVEMFNTLLNKLTHYFLHRAIEQLEAKNELHCADTVIDF